MIIQEVHDTKASTIRGVTSCFDIGVLPVSENIKYINFSNGTEENCGTEEWLFFRWGGPKV